MRRPFLAGTALLGFVGCGTVIWATWPFGRAVDTIACRTASGRYYGVIWYQNHVAAMTSTWTSPFALGDREPTPASHRFVFQSAVTVPFSKMPARSIWNHLGLYDWAGASLVLANDEQIRDEKWLVPSWVAAAPFLLPAMVWLALTCRDRRRLANQLCVSCGYYLRGTHAQCPECGRKVGSRT